MKEYRKSPALDSSSEYSFVEMGPIPDRPRWHRELYAHQTYPFPTMEAAFRFAEAHKHKEPDRCIAVISPDGRKVVLEDPRVARSRVG
ncbi:hypothetical protein SEA_SHAM4_71 [Mycobacterium phage Sham4]|nr:hypothetical protein SEA_SALZ_70 [Mycobacterium phage Salz]QFG05049.1 RecB-like exonuclease/helicase [Mycobacterium phage Hutc2]UOW92716.1 hypothetical protein SEA_SHAM4_71 [Mycobacterium phage Sham4]UXE03383.1 hypothetical protein SEA_GILBERTA_72 [Mycobacterium phage Gilberta]